MAEQGATKNRILDAAELLFAEHGFKETSLRAITTAASANLASVNYHYGDKKGLIRAVLSRYLELFIPAFKMELVALHQRDEFDMNDVFLCTKRPLLRLNSFKNNGTTIFMSLISHGYTDVQGHLRWFITTHYDDVIQLFIGAVRRAYPCLDPETLFWRLHFTLGASVFTMTSSTALCDIADSNFSNRVQTEDLINRLVPYLAAGVTAPIELRRV
ncbi:TetR/AcrR family transcriptional regulator [Photobacterium kishitanii]|uniref:TetR/AcrR family transcriptional regulator n=1 Tax=Photobacterium kishitanii TaxID=318456 RepID=A0A0B7JE73_9GAMM|nr:TetR/AcrR family transcriptional regulator [Photobacterium kishitanii]PSU92253.1 TetR/AcrR family transcriptional regulator [Photobacterium kishitanii]PSU97088.1 TetR/AcrR family transcriptional regulator [Photobacterium kishitanii]PSV01803.1 TetR/AcrR family transcriptional regulator [Photobacterium kishitanii]PSV14786.1 TetR/AcrR family transcriptional regulator [Photobacterium kishitanii]CEO39668.1 Transcriptional regulator, TetR family protein [Photobacterium kishitanii]